MPYAPTSLGPECPDPYPASGRFHRELLAAFTLLFFAACGTFEVVAFSPDGQMLASCQREWATRAR